MDKTHRESLKWLLTSKESAVYDFAKTILHAVYSEVIESPAGLIAIGDIPVALVAHIDTIYDTPPSVVYYDNQEKVMWSPSGLGADDRAGVFAIIQILEYGYKPSIILTRGEEQGAIGAKVFGKKACIIPNLKYLIELDRAGEKDCVFYQCNNRDFVQYIESFGFAEALGSYTDITFLMPKWEVCGVNLSIGYEDEHSCSETLHIEQLENTIVKVINLLTSASAAPDFVYTEAKPTIGINYCGNCYNIMITPEEAIEVKKDNGVIKYVCKKCMELK